CIFFFQAEDGIRDRNVTGVQTCALPISISLTGQLAGVEAGANQYFNKHVSDLNLAECASIAAITKNPTKYNPATNPEEHILRRKIGRASCRERVEIAGAAGPDEKKEKAT